MGKATKPSGERFRTTWVCALAFALVGALASGCTPSIGDACELSTQCGSRGDRVCDLSQPAGYCTVPSCRGGGCPDSAACIFFGAQVPGCAGDGRELSRTGRSFCQAGCEEDGDCRAGYVCRDPRNAPWFALVLDDPSTERPTRVCLPRPIQEDVTTQVSVEKNPPVCSAATPVTSPTGTSQPAPSSTSSGTASSGVSKVAP
jgi:hypothetical protein